ncbi:MAG: GNAT family N-acetyltransferase [Lachnospiraceae bacterium]|nr:GNAT family N-acetyltransferase [Lachnospiraceae bacterium]
MELVLAGDFVMVREKYIEVIKHTKDMNIHARWIYGQHPTDAMIQSYIDGQEMYLFMDEQNVAGMTAITMYQGEDYQEILWSQNLKDDEVASLHILTVAPEYQGKGVSKKMMAEIISLVRKNGKKSIRLDTLASNIPAQHMYEKLGFEYRGKKNLYAENTGWTDFLYYELPLNKEIEDDR